MEASLLVGLGLVLLGGFFQGSFMLPAKWIHNWNWEHYWLIFAATAYLISPWTLAFITVPSLPAIYSGISAATLIKVGVFGLTWGIGTVMFGRGVDLLGMSLGFTIIIGIASSAGTLIPLVAAPPAHFSVVPAMITGLSLAIMLVGVAVCSSAGGWKESQGKARGHYRRGVIICIWSGLFSAGGNVGFSLAKEVTQRAQALGAPADVAQNALWALLTLPLFLCNTVFALSLMRCNRSFGQYRAPRSGRNLLFSISMGICWMIGIGIYGTGTRQLGPLGASLGWSIMMSAMVVAANGWGVATGEWRLSPVNMRKRLAAGVFLLLLAIGGLGLVNAL